MTTKKVIAVLLSIIEYRKEYTEQEINEAIELARDILISSYANRVGL